MFCNRSGAINSFSTSLILPCSASLVKSEFRPNRQKVACQTNMAVSNLVTPSTRNVYSSSTTTSEKHKLQKPKRKISFSNSKRNVATSGVNHFRERLFKKAVLETASQLIASTRQKTFRVKSQLDLENVG